MDADEELFKNLTADFRRLGNSKAQASKEINRRHTQTNADEDVFTAETSLDWARDLEPVERQRAPDQNS